jgi:hypothetical protein
MLDGVWVPVLAICMLALVWAIILYGSSFFGPKVE